MRDARILPFCSVHPRVCGEHLTDAADHYRMAGSSPRVRGTLLRSLRRRYRHRFIPACAGNTAPSTAADIASNGSSPRVRGTPQSHPEAANHISVHPRVCGEHLVISIAILVAFGSSPRVRGTRPYRGHQLLGIRFIPACAGNTCRWAATRRRRSVHPRVCGEHPSAARRGARWIGSSPRVRGTRVDADPARVNVRFIPACAGNTGPHRGRVSGDAVHPRVCGEHTRWRCLAWVARGSSPRVRGTQIVSPRPHGVERFIPACAGNTAAVRPTRTPSPVHPRVCGEHGISAKPRYFAVGSSPRVRGTHRRG